MSTRVAVVTGGSKGIGRAIAQRLATDGFDVVAASRHPSEPDGAIRAAALDVTDAAEVRAFFADLPRCDLLVNNAGLAGANELGDLDAWNAILATNLTGTYLCCAAVAARLPDRDGRIVNIASVLGLRGVPDQTAYCAAKHGVIGLTRSLAMALAPRGITVNAICPSWVGTEMATKRFAELGITEQEAGEGLPIGRISTPGEVADAVAFFVRQGTMTGVALPLDGGATASV
ncbi:MAG TPA: SDR family NAD(P)-dependent oxidoreductase [Acetobacteraceae bacterium]|nr:SDR family NAD(P)-dependent oxidoreductase [Acetobacteraceae bacterium]